MSKHESVSSKEMESREAELQMHQPVSSEGAVPTPGEGGDALVAGDFKGASEGELEAVTGFDESYARREGDVAQEIAVTKELATIRPCCAEEFGAPEDVCGRDDRVRISPATQIPWRWNCQLIITMANGNTSRCTGFMIGPRTVMTAGHCVYSHSAGGWAKKIEVIPGCDGSSRPFGSQVATSFRSVVGWTRDKDWNYDYGAIILPDNTLGNRVGYFGFASLTDASLKDLLVNNAGYAGDKPFGTLWFNAGRITKVEERKLFYMIDTYGGHSGSPVWRLKDGVRHVVGIHAYGGCPNSATRIVQAVFDNMLAWRNIS